MKRTMSVRKTIWPLKTPIRITGYAFEALHAIEVEIGQDGHVGRGEGCGVYYLDDFADSMIEQVEATRRDLASGLTREELLQALPAGGARNAIDCALWDLESHLTGQSIWRLTAISPRKTRTVFTIGIEDSVQKMAKKAAAAREYPILKIKLDGVTPVERVAAIREARPDATLIVDANQGFSISLLEDIAGPLSTLGVLMIEQPLPRGCDQALEGFNSPVPICADESCLHRGELQAAVNRYDMINIKLDKTGGLTEALYLARDALAAGKRLMVGNMFGSSLSMAPSYVVAQLCDFVDLDGPLALKSDFIGGLTYNQGIVGAPSPGFWGGMT